MPVSPENNKFIYSRITFELADAIKAADNNMLHIDDALIVAATPTVLLNYKAIEDKDLKRIMIAMKRFFKHNPRFLDFTKAAVSQGLREEWLPTLEDSEKGELLADLILTPAVDENGYVIFNPTVFANLTKSEHPDRETYGKADYTPRPTRKYAAKRSKVLLTSVSPDAKLAEKLAPYIDWYKKNWEYLHSLEDYKWQAIHHFQEVFDINAEDLATNLKEAFKFETNLLSGPMYMPLSMLLKNAKLSPDDVRQALVNLYDESQPLATRSQAFLEDFTAINQRNKEAGYLRENERDMQSDRATSVYLAFRYPDKHYLYKSSVWNDFKSEVELDYPSLYQFVGKLSGYEMIANQIRDVLLADDELVALLKASEPTDDYDGHVLTQDFMYAIAVHLLNLSEKK